MAKRVNRDADSIIRSKIPTIRERDTDARFKGGESSVLYYEINTASTASFGKKWPNQMRSMTITNTSDTVDALVSINISTSKLSGDATVLNKVKIRTNAALILTEDDVTIGTGEYFKITTTAAAGTPTILVAIRF
tara:strand:- start:43 stop:447 length:405 start_codon:yes stop_codon:yes gene_type:complete